MHIALIAPTGRAGSRILAELVNRGHHVTAIGRNLDSVPDRPEVTGAEDDLASADRIASIIEGADAVVSAFGPASSDPRYTTDIAYTDQLVDVTRRLVDAVRAAGAPRLVVVGGCGSLQFSPGVTVLESGAWPEPYVAIATSHATTLSMLRDSDINWTYFSPPMSITPGERTGTYRLGGDDLLRDEAGTSGVSFEDYAVALVDELETPQHERARFTIAY